MGDVVVIEHFCFHLRLLVADVRSSIKVQALIRMGECSVLSLLYTWVGWDDGGVGPVIERWESDPSN